MDEYVSGLECCLGRARVGVPIEAVGQLIEYEAAPLPLSRPWVRGVAFHQGRVIVSVGLVGSLGPGKVKGIVLEVAGAKVWWVLEVTEVLKFVRARVHEARPTAANTRLPSWVSGATTDDGRVIGWLHAEVLARRFSEIDDIGTVE